MDIHKQFTVAVVKDEQGKEIEREKFENGKEQFAAFLKPYPSKETSMVMESTYVWEYIYEILDSLGYHVKLANPLRTRAIAEARIKTDAIDASTLADLLRADLIAESYIPTKEIRQWRELTRERRIFVKQQTQLINRIRAILTKRGIALPTKELGKKAMGWLEEIAELDDVLYHYMNLLKYLQRELKILEGRIKDLAYKNKDAELLMSIPGIGPLRAMDILTEIGDVARFLSADKLCSYAGLVPGVRQSGTTLRFGRLVKQAKNVLKYTLVEAAWTTIRVKEPNQFQVFYRKLSAKIGKQKAICATARKMCCTVYTLLKNQEEFRYL